MLYIHVCIYTGHDYNGQAGVIIAYPHLHEVAVFINQRTTMKSGHSARRKTGICGYPTIALRLINIEGDCSRLYADSVTLFSYHTACFALYIIRDVRWGKMS